MNIAPVEPPDGDDLIGKYVRVRIPWRGSTAWLTGKVVARNGELYRLDKGWHFGHAQDEIIYCGNEPCPEPGPR